MRRFETHYRLRSSDYATPDTFNPRLRDIDDRLHAQEELRAEIEALQRTLVAQAAGRIDDVLLPALAYVQTIQQGGFLTAPIADETSLEFVEGTVSVAVDQTLKAIFRPTPFVAIMRSSTHADWAVAQALGYDAETGVLSLDIVAVNGSAGPHEDVIFSATAGALQAQIAYLSPTLAAAEAATAAAATASAAAGTMAAGVETATEKAAAATDAAAIAVAAAEAAATWDPGNYYQKGETYAQAEVDAALAGKADSSGLAAVATSGSYEDLTGRPDDLLTIALMRAFNTSDTDFPGGLYDRPSATTIDAGESANLNGYTATANSLQLETFTSNTDPAGFTFAMTPNIDVAGSEYKATDSDTATGPATTGGTTSAAWSVMFPSGRVITNWSASIAFVSARAFVAYLDLHIDGAWVEVDSYTREAATTALSFSGSLDGDAPADGVRLRVVWTGNTNITFKDVNVTQAFLATWVSQAIALDDVYDQFAVAVTGNTTGGLTAADIAVDLSRDDGETWTEVEDLVEIARQGTTVTLQGSIDLTGQPSGSNLRYRIRQTTAYGVIVTFSSIMIRWG